MSEDALVPIENQVQGWEEVYNVLPSSARWYTSNDGQISKNFHTLNTRSYGYHPASHPIYASEDFLIAWRYLAICAPYKETFVRRDDDFVQVKDLYYAIEEVETVITNNVRALYEAWLSVGVADAIINAYTSKAEAELLIENYKEDREREQWDDEYH
ncbi:hypothetical protein B0H16DRAFT_1730904 [Mycena metata]|uniref:Uncharacterized protein n=1 Tax=Mycena metata TaxID=1033252 RepID=A0AAD7MXH0_9AGAR|nr:hypothetical protein B0H16DRAFT_1735367 [Mycena metata]KAJ7732563.1 hypothetical protein B0H16DRAFT_1732758 [Mycena metata]KAJ7736321.1 hypothetical protein B0H16DRAFT_1730904 [Mycena metata]